MRRSKKSRVKTSLKNRGLGRPSFSKRGLVIFGLLAGVVGGYFIINAFAATPRFSIRFMTNSGGDQATVASYGFNVLDVGSASDADSLPAGTVGQIWVGDYDNNTCNFEMSDAAVTSVVTAAVGDPRVSGYFYSDEPDPFACPNAYNQHAARNSLIKSLDPGHYTMMLMDTNSAQQTLDQIPHWVGKADYIALDPYPCYADNTSTCDYSWIDTVTQAADAVGMNYWIEVQAFTGGAWRWPTPTELQHMLDQTAASRATGYMAFAWTWLGVNLTSQPALLTVLQNFNQGGGTPPPTDTTPPTVSLTAPVNGATVTGNVTVSANASDNIAVAGVQFKLNGNALQSEDTTAPYSVTWSTTSVPNGSYTLTATARDTSGNTTTSSGRTVTVSNTAPPPGTTYTVVAAGDVCSSGTDPDDCKGTAVVINQINPDAVLTLGDNAYNDGSASDFASEYEPNWGQFKSKTYPSPGNHDYHISGAADYFSYFGSRAPAEFYSFNLGSSWHLISLPGDIGPTGGAGAGSPQEVWLKNDLATHPNMCTIAYWHEPRWSSGDVHGSEPEFDQIIKDLYAAHADIVLTGHDHFYERFAPQNPQGQPDPTNGILNFVVGTGGSPIDGYGFVSPPVANSVVRNNQVKGVLKLTLRQSSYDYQFMPSAGYSLNDSGSGTCHNSGVAPPADTTPPTVSMSAPSNGATVSGSSVTVSANASDNVGVYGVQFKLDGNNIGAEDVASPYSISWNTTTIANGSHTLTAVARDAAGNSTTSTAITVTVNNTGPPPTCPNGDVNGDCHVTITDLSIMLSNWSTSNATCDLNHNGTVDIFDLSIMLSNYGK
jgi:hypothetical protein